MRLKVAIVLAGLSASPAWAVTGAELIEYQHNFSLGYIYGAVDYYVYTSQPEPSKFETWERRRNCVGNSGLSNEAMYGSVKQYILNNPPLLTKPAFIAVLDWMAELCP